MRKWMGVMMLAGSIITTTQAQTPKGDYPDVEFWLVSTGGMAGTGRMLAAAEITCGLGTNAPPSGAGANTFYLTWFDPLNQGMYCQADITKDVNQLAAGSWYGAITLMLPPVTWMPCPEYEVNGGCWAKTLDGGRYPTYDIPGHETPVFTVGVFVRPPSNLTVKVD